MKQNESDIEKNNSETFTEKGVEKIPTYELNRIKNVVAVMSGKGGVGKSTVTGLLAVSLQKEGPLIANAIKQFWTDVVWGDLDYLLIDLPPGTSDEPLTVMQSLPINGLIIVSSPQDLVLMVVKKAIKMAEMMNIPVLGIVENYSYLVYPKCGERIEVFGESRGEEVERQAGIPFLGSLPVDYKLAQLCDRGEIESYKSDEIKGISEWLKHTERR